MANWDYYVGEWENDVIYGPGLYCHGKQKLIYDGNFKNDQREGEGEGKVTHEKRVVRAFLSCKNNDRTA